MTKTPTIDGSGRRSGSLLREGDVVADRYEIIALLGTGGMGAVYRARQRGLQREVALKLIRPERQHRTSARERFIREARTAAMLRHPGVVSVHDFGEHEGALFLVMELLVGPSLRDLVDEHLPLLSVARAVELTARIADVLDAASSVGLVHRDLKPDNVVLDRDEKGSERLVVVDFGLAFVVEAGDVGRMTREGVVAGTPDYMSPEQCRGSLELGPASDVYSLGIMAYEMLTGTTPFSGEVALVLSRHLFVAPPRVREVVAERRIPGVLEDLVARMLAKDASERPSAAEVRDRLNAMDVTRPERSSEHATGASRLGRAARMISQGESWTPPPPNPVMPLGLRVGWIGPRVEEVELSLAVHGVELSEPADADVVFSCAEGGDARREIAQWVSEGKVVVVQAPSGAEELASLLRLGVADVHVAREGGEVLARKLLRAARRKK